MRDAFKKREAEEGMHAMQHLIPSTTTRCHLYRFAATFLVQGLRRIDAAVDALGQLGFARNVVCKTVNNLLKVYGGDDGWSFIEDASYGVVIEAILQEQEKAIKDEGETGDDAGALEVPEQAVGDGQASSHVQASADTHPDISCTDQVSGNRLQGQCQLASTLEEVGEPSNASLHIGPSDPQQPVVPSTPRRKPCYGWISEDEEEAEDPPGDTVVGKNQEKVQSADGLPKNQEKVQSADGLCRVKRRKSGWDVKPFM